MAEIENGALGSDVGGLGAALLAVEAAASGAMVTRTPIGPTKGIQIVEGGEVTDVHSFPAEAVVSADGRQISWSDKALAAPDGWIFFDQPGAQQGWLLEDGKLVAPPVPPPSVEDIAAQILGSATHVCGIITQQVVPDETHRTAYTNAATIVWGNGGKAPTAEPAKTIFSAQAAALGLKPETFASVVQAVSLVSLELATLLSTLRGSTSAAETYDQLKDALAAFETGLVDLVTKLNGAGLTITVAAPEAILIEGFNA